MDPTTSTEVVDAAARLRHTTTRLFRALRRQSDVGLSLSRISMLATIRRAGPLPVGALAEEEQISAPSATKIIDSLHRAGLIERQDHATDRRVRVVSLTESGDEILDDIRSRRTAWLAARLADLEADDLRRLTDALDVLEGLCAPPPRPAGPPNSPPTRPGDDTGSADASARATSRRRKPR